MNICKQDRPRLGAIPRHLNIGNRDFLRFPPKYELEAFDQS